MLERALGFTNVCSLECQLFVLSNKAVQESWEYYTPEFVFITELALACVLGFAIFIMFGWHLWSIGQGETSVETQDNDQYRNISKSRGQVCDLVLLATAVCSRPFKEFVNSYDLG